MIWLEFFFSISDNLGRLGHGFEQSFGMSSPSLTSPFMSCVPISLLTTHHFEFIRISLYPSDREAPRTENTDAN